MVVDHFQFLRPIYVENTEVFKLRKGWRKERQERDTERNKSYGKLGSLAKQRIIDIKSTEGFLDKC